MPAAVLDELLATTTASSGDFARVPRGRVAPRLPGCHVVCQVVWIHPPDEMR